MLFRGVFIWLIPAKHSTYLILSWLWWTLFYVWASCFSIFVSLRVFSFYFSCWWQSDRSWKRCLVWNIRGLPWSGFWLLLYFFIRIGWIMIIGGNSFGYPSLNSLFLGLLWLYTGSFLNSWFFHWLACAFFRWRPWWWMAEIMNLPLLLNVKRL